MNIINKISKNHQKNIYIALCIINLIFIINTSHRIIASNIYYSLTLIILGVIFFYGYISKINSIISLSISSFIISLLFVDLMTYRMTSWYFHQVPNEIINIILDTNPDEINSNFFFSTKEIIGLLIIACNFLFILIGKRDSKFQLRHFYIFIILFVSLLIAFKPLGLALKEINKGLSELKKNAQIIKDKKNFKWDSKSTINDKQTVVLFLGETNRGDYLHFNGYPKNTTPNLDKENLVSFKNTISQGAYTLVSTPMILSRKGVYDNGLFNETSIISAYKEAGYETWYVSYLSKSHIGDNEINLIANEADHYVVSDVNVNTLEKILNNKSKKKLIVYKTIGSHYLYHTRYPSNYDVFKPSFNEKTYSTPSLKDKDKLENSYANSELFSVDKQISDFINVLKNTDGLAYLSFISDHGTAIYDDGKSLYGGNTKGNYNIAHFFWFNDLYHKQHPELIQKLSINKDKKITSECFVDTSLELSFIESKIKKGCSLLNDKFIEKQRLVKNGKVYDFDQDLENDFHIIELAKT